MSEISERKPAGITWMNLVVARHQAAIAGDEVRCLRLNLLINGLAEEFPEAVQIEKSLWGSSAIE